MTLNLTTSEDLVLARLDAAHRALAEAESLQDKKHQHLVDLSAAAEVYARRQGASAEVRGKAHAIHIEALRLLGEALKAGPKAQASGSNQHKEVFRDGTAPQRLVDLGVDRKVSMVAQKLAALPAKHFESVRAGNETVADALRQIKAARR